MRGVRGGLTAVACCLAIGCSGSGSGSVDPLGGVGEGTAARLCQGFFADADAVRNARNQVTPDALDLAARGYETRAVDARSGGAKAFASTLMDASGAVHALAQSSRSALASGASGTTAGQSASMAPFLTIATRLQLAEARISLACYSRGYTRP